MAGGRTDVPKFRRRLGDRPGLLLALIVAPFVLIPLAVAGFNLSRELRFAPPTAQPDRAYSIATAGRCGTIPLPRKVELLEEEAPAGLAEGVVKGGEYDLGTGTISIRRFPEPGASFVFARVLTHEYGHAFLHDYCRSRAGDVAAGMLTAQIAALGPYDEAWLGSELDPVYHDYVANPEAFGGYASATFGEWMAEAYAHYVSAAPLPAETARFYALAARMDQDIRECDHCHGE